MSSPPSIALQISDIIAPLQNGGLGSLDALDNEVFGMCHLPYLEASLTSLLSPVANEEETPETSFEAELSKVELKDTSSMLADLESEVSTMVSGRGWGCGLIM